MMKSVICSKEFQELKKKDAIAKDVLFKIENDDFTMAFITFDFTDSETIYPVIGLCGCDYNYIYTHSGEYTRIVDDDEMEEFMDYAEKCIVNLFSSDEENINEIIKIVKLKVAIQHQYYIDEAAKLIKRNRKAV